LFPFDGVLGLDAEDEIVVCCHHGARSDAGAQILIESGFPRVANLIGGIGTHTHLRGRSGRATGWATRPKTGCFALIQAILARLRWSDPGLKGRLVLCEASVRLDS
jgi:hypothetical protein